MLIAWARGKKRSSDVGYEDEILSAVFGPLRYMDSSSRAAVARAIVNAAFFGRPTSHVTNNIGECRLDFWPNLAESGRVEPDLIFEMRSDSSLELVVIVEAKWKSPLHNCQLIDQWTAARNKYENTAVLHIFLAMSAISFEEMQPKDEEHRSCLVCMTWSQLASALQTLTDNGLLLLWAKDTLNFLVALDQIPFSGLDHVFQTQRPRREMWRTGWIFSPMLMDANKFDSCPQWQAVMANSTKNWKFQPE